MSDEREDGEEESPFMEVGKLREILAHYDAKVRVVVEVDFETLDVKSSYTTYGGSKPDRLVLWAATGYKAMLLSPAEQAAVEKMREKGEDAPPT